MNDPATELHAASRFPVWLACAWLTLAMVAVFPCLCIYAYPTHAWAGIAAASVAFCVNWWGALAALLLVAGLRRGPWVLHGVLAAMVVRMLLPLAVGLFLTHRGGPLVNAGVFGMIVVYYLVGLVIETLLAVRLVGVASKSLVRIV